MVYPFFCLSGINPHKTLKDPCIYATIYCMVNVAGNIGSTDFIPAVSCRHKVYIYEYLQRHGTD